MGSLTRIGAFAAVGMMALGACSSGHKAATPPAGSTTSTSAAGSEVKIGTATVGSLGQVLVNSQGRTLYVLSSESAGKPLTCTTACLTYWPPVTVPTSTTMVAATGGAQASLLGTHTYGTATYVTYGGYPLYLYAGDSAAGQSNGEGVSSFGGTWYALTTAGHPAMPSTSSTTPTTAASSSGGY